MDYNLEGKVFRSVANTANGEAGGDTFFYYHQTADGAPGVMAAGRRLHAGGRE